MLHTAQGPLMSSTMSKLSLNELMTQDNKIFRVFSIPRKQGIYFNDKINITFNAIATVIG